MSASNEEVFRAALEQIRDLASRSDAHPDIEVGTIARAALEAADFYEVDALRWYRENLMLKMPPDIREGQSLVGRRFVLDTLVAQPGSLRYEAESIIDWFADEGHDGGCEGSCVMCQAVHHLRLGLAKERA